MDYKDFLKLSRFPTNWCDGCGASIVLNWTAKQFEALGYSKKDTTIVSGIGCTGRGAGYFALDSVHGLHGRSVPLAEGIKLAKPELNVVVFSGDGDLLGIGGNHLIHACRRNTDITIICVNNNIYGMTGGQKAPTTPKGTKTITSPEGVEETPINSKALIRAHGHIYARSTVFHVKHMSECIKQALEHKGLAFVEIISSCTSNYGRRLGYKNAGEMLMTYKEQFKIVEDVKDLEPDELGILK
jgi:2-oxoglutarate ferredoxin oxidoreductase subunit beta